MSRTIKDYKSNKKFDNRLCEYKSGFKKFFKRHSNKKIRQTPITSPHIDMIYSECEVTLKIPKDIVKGSTPVDKDIKVNIVVSHPEYVEVENYPIGLDPWMLD